MRKFTDDMKYEYIKDEDYYISREQVCDGTVRVIKDKLRYSENDIMYSDDEVFDTITGKMTTSQKIVVWREVELL